MRHRILVLLLAMALIVAACGPSVVDNGEGSTTSVIVNHNRTYIHHIVIAWDRNHRPGWHHNHDRCSQPGHGGGVFLHG